jgi:hypothetical protein
MNAKIAMLLAIYLFLLTACFAFEASGNTYDLNLGDEGDLAGNASNASVDMNFILSGEAYAIGQSQDYNVELGVYFPTAPSITITSPTSGSTSSSSTATLTYSGIDEDNDIIRYFVKADNSAWIDNGTNISYSFTNLSTGSHTLKVIAVDSFYLVSSEASTSITISSSSPSQNTNPGAGTANPINASAEESTPTSTKPTIIIVTDEASSSALELLDESFFNDLQIMLSNEVQTSRGISWVGGNSSSNASNFSFVVTVKNVSEKTITDVHVVEYIPKEIAENISQITFQDKIFKVIKADPIVEWVVPELSPGKAAALHYSVNKLNTNTEITDLNSLFKQTPAPAALEKKTEAGNDSCSEVACNSNDPCKKGICSSGKCLYIQQTNALPECSSGCITPLGCPKIDKGGEIMAPLNFTWVITPFAVLLILFIIEFQLHRKERKKHAHAKHHYKK